MINNPEGAQSTASKRPNFRSRIGTHLYADSVVIGAITLLGSERFSILERIGGGAVLAALMSAYVELDPLRGVDRLSHTMQATLTEQDGSANHSDV